MRREGQSEKWPRRRSGPSIARRPELGAGAATGTAAGSETAHSTSDRGSISDRAVDSGRARISGRDSPRRQARRRPAESRAPAGVPSLTDRLSAQGSRGTTGRVNRTPVEYARLDPQGGLPRRRPSQKRREAGIDTPSRRATASSRRAWPRSDVSEPTRHGSRPRRAWDVPGGWWTSQHLQARHREVRPSWSAATVPRGEYAVKKQQPFARSITADPPARTVPSPSDRLESTHRRAQTCTSRSGNLRLRPGRQPLALPHRYLNVS
jgi:hypothetical protein